MSIDPKWRFAISIVVTIAIGISQGTLVLTNAVPTAWIPIVAAWCGIIAFVGSAVNTTISGMGMSPQSRIDAAASLPQVKAILTEPPVAAATPSEKVVGTIAAAQAVAQKAA
jgi:hypothetical protein